MGAFWAKQPNGKYCRFSSVVDGITHYDCEKEDILQWRIDEAKRIFEADWAKGDYIKPFEKVIQHTVFHTFEALDEFKKMYLEMGGTEAEFKVDSEIIIKRSIGDEDE